jgi:pimeloyl-ACP methyl ester carboxylesterase
MNVTNRHIHALDTAVRGEDSCVDVIRMNSSGYVVRMVNSAFAAGPKKGAVIVVPPFGRRIADLTFVALVLQENGFDVARFDARSHVGESSGEIEDFTLGGLAEDLGAVRESFGEDQPLILVGISLSAPVALRYAAENAGIKGVLTLAGVVDVPDTLRRILGPEVVAAYMAGRPGPDTCEIFGYRVRADGFSADALARGYDGLDATIADVAAITAPIHLIAAEDDELVAIEDVKRVATELPEGSNLTLIENSTHEFSRSMSATRHALEALARGCLRIVGDPCAEPSMPLLTTLIDRHSSEQRLLRELNSAQRQPEAT